MSQPISKYTVQNLRQYTVYLNIMMNYFLYCPGLPLYYKDGKSDTGNANWANGCLLLLDQFI